MAVSLGTALSNVLRVLIQQGGLELAKIKDPAHAAIENSTDVTSQGIGKDWNWKFPVFTGVAGGGKFQPVDVATQWENYGQTGFPNRLSASEKFPTRSESTVLGFSSYQVTLMKYLLNLILPYNLLQASYLDAAAVQFLSLNLKGLLNRKLIDQMRNFYATPNAGTEPNLSRPVGTIASNGSIDTANAPDIATISFSDARVNMFPVGSILDSYAVNTLQAPLVVLAQNKVAGTIIVGRLDGTNVVAGDVAAANVLYVQGSKISGSAGGYGMNGPFSWMKTPASAVATTFVQNIDTYLLPEIGSFVFSSPQVLSEPVLNKDMGNFNDAYGDEIDMGVTTTQVLNKWADTIRNGFGVAGSAMTPYRIDRTNSPLKIAAGFVGVEYTYGPKSVPIFASPYIPSGRAFFGKFGNGNVVRLTPPRVQGMGRMAMYGEVDFVGGFGGNSPWLNVSEQSGSTEVAATMEVQIPGVCIYNYAAKMPMGITYSNLIEA